MTRYLLLCLLLFCSGISLAQVPVRTQRPVNADELVPLQGNPGAPNNPSFNVQPQATTRTDTIGFERRNDAADSITIQYRFPDSTRKYSLDSSVLDFDRYYPVPSSYLCLGNNGAAALPILYQPYAVPGFDPGFHAYDIYRFTVEQTRLYQTTRPFSSLSYQLASGKEQMLMASHTQNPRPNLNFGFDYRLITAPGFFVTQNTNHNAFRVYTTYQGRRKRYQSALIFLGNRIRASENGGIQNDSFLLDPNRKDRFSVPVNLGNNAAYRNNPFVTTVLTGNQYQDLTLWFRHSYDLGRRDSLQVNDSTKEYLFYPRLRLQHTFRLSTNQYRFSDVIADSVRYADWYDQRLRAATDTFSLYEKWRILHNEFSLVQFPDTRNLAQFFRAGAAYQLIEGQVRSGTLRFHNFYLSAEYRNRTRNRKWNLLLNGMFYLSGLNAGDYQAEARLERVLSPRLGNIQLWFRNVNRNPSFMYDSRSSFRLDTTQVSLNKENITSFSVEWKKSAFQLSLTNHLIASLAYYQDRYRTDQYAPLINLTRMSGSFRLKLVRKWYWYAEGSVQRVDRSAPVRVPLLYTRNRLVFEGKFFKNLQLHTGLEARYFTPFRAYGYSPVPGQFYVQNEVELRNLPDVAAFAHFRIRGFAGYLRVENLNTAYVEQGLAFVNNNFAAPHYPTQGLMFRLGIQWWFVN